MPASPRAVRCVCFAAGALLAGSGWIGAAGATPVKQPPAESPTTIAATTATTPTTAAESTTAPGPTDAPTSTEPASTSAQPPTIDVLRAGADEVRDALAATADRRAGAQADLGAARAEVTAAEDAAAAATAAEEAAADRAEALDADVRAAAVDAYIGGGQDAPLGVLAGATAQDASWQFTVLQYQAEELTALLDDQRSAHRSLEAERRSAADAAEDAETAAAQAQGKVDELIRLESDQAVLVSQVDDRLESALSEAAALAAIDEQAAAALASQEQALANAAALSVSAPPAAPTKTTKAPATKAPASTTTPTVTIPPGPTAPPTSAPPPTTAPSGPTPTPAPVDVVNVGGFIVARSLADQLGQLLAAAQAAGLVLGGSGHRDVAAQIDLRRQHCGPTDADIWFKPASLCSPPTAIPGRSMHEKGLAIDITCSGVLIRDRASPCFTWLAANAASFGLYNLPSEPWHWSTNGN